jgi:hypothetical protein
MAGIGKFKISDALRQQQGQSAGKKGEKSKQTQDSTVGQANEPRERTRTPGTLRRRSGSS